MSNVFERLAPFIQEYIYEKRWSELKSIQGRAIEVILDTENHMLLSAGTASGKTEAAFFPILTQLDREKPISVQVLYIGPLKALINDQFERLNDLLVQARIRTWRWHGDVSANQKKKLLERPSGILQITPESLEAMMMRHTGDIGKLFCGLRYIVIDEIHAFMGTDRGGQLLCQIVKIERWAKCSPRRIGLSATLNNSNDAAAWLASGSGVPVECVVEANTRKQVRLAVDWFSHDMNDKSAAEENESLTPTKSAFYDEIYRQCYDTKSIIFTNSRSAAEETIAHMREIARRQSAPDIFHVHHGSISKALRLEAEEAMREQDGPTVTAATLTLELGIDIGKLERILQIGAPYSCSSFVQRLGRSGRRSGVSEMYFSEYEERRNTGDPFDAIPWPLIQMIAVIQLFIEERWVEPILVKPLPYSLLYQQTMSMLASVGELSAQDLARSVLSLPPFSRVPQADYKQLLLHWIDKDHLQWTDEHTLLIGLTAEPIVNHFTFYAVFPDEDSYSVIYDGKELGTIDSLPPDGVTFALAGRFWMAVDSDLQGKVVFVRPSQRSKVNLWRGGGGDVHTRIVRKMRDILVCDEEYPYLLNRAQQRLYDSRAFARKSAMLESQFVSMGNDGILVVPWLGTCGMRTLDALFRHSVVKNALKLQSVRQENSFSFLIRSDLPLHHFQEELYKLCRQELDLSEGLLPKEIPFIDKYDYLLTPELFVKQYANNFVGDNDLLAWFS